MPSSEQKSVVTVRISEAMKASLQRAADEKGGNLSAEILHRLADYKSLRGFIDRLLDDSMAINVAVGLKTLRERIRASKANSSSDDETASLECAVATAACISELFTVVADHAGHALAAKSAADLVDPAIKEGESMASQVGATIGPNIWDVCFAKDNPLRSTSMGDGLMGNMSTLLTSGVRLPLPFMPLPTIELNRDAFVGVWKDSEAIRDAAKHQINEGRHPGKSEKEVIDILFDDLVKSFSMEPSETSPDVAES